MVTWLVQIVARRVLQQWDFTLSRGERGLRIERGLLSRTSQTIPFNRVQGIAIREPFVWRRLGWQRLEVDVAGYASHGDEQGLDSSSILLPIADRALAAAVIAELIAGRERRCAAHPCAGAVVAVRPGGLAVPLDRRRPQDVRGQLGLDPAVDQHRPPPQDPVGRAASGAAATTATGRDDRGPHARPGRSTPTAAASTRPMPAPRSWPSSSGPGRRAADQPPEVASSASGSSGAVTSAAVEPAVGHRHLLGGALAAARRAQLGHRVRLGGVEPGQQLVEIGQRARPCPSRWRTSLPAGEALEVPGDVLAELDAAALGAHDLGQQLGVAAHDAGRPRRGSAARRPSRR